MSIHIIHPYVSPCVRVSRCIISFVALIFCVAFQPAAEAPKETEAPKEAEETAKSEEPAKTEE